MLLYFLSGADAEIDGVDDVTKNCHIVAEDFGYVVVV